MDEYTRGKLAGTNRKIGDIPVDQETGHLPIVSPILNQVFRGNMWAFAHRVRDIGENEHVYVQIDTGANPVQLHRVKFWSNTALAELDLIRGPDLTSGEDAIPIYRLNHLLPTPEPEGLHLFSDPEDIEGGTVCPCNFMGGGDALAIGSRASADLREMPLIMSPSTTYIISVKNLENSDRDFAVQGFICVEQD